MMGDETDDPQQTACDEISTISIISICDEDECSVLTSLLLGDELWAKQARE